MWEWIVIIIIVVIIVGVAAWMFSGSSRPLVPPSISEAFLDGREIVVRWSPVPGATGYMIYYRVEGQTIESKSPSRESPYRILGVDPCKKYYISITSTYQGLESARSPQIVVDGRRIAGPKIEAAVRRENTITVILPREHRGTYKVMAGLSRDNLNLMGVPRQQDYVFIDVSSITPGTPIIVQATETDRNNCESLPSEIIVK